MSSLAVEEINFLHIVASNYPEISLYSPEFYFNGITTTHRSQKVKAAH